VQLCLTGEIFCASSSLIVVLSLILCSDGGLIWHPKTARKRKLNRPNQLTTQDRNKNTKDCRHYRNELGKDVLCKSCLFIFQVSSAQLVTRFVNDFR